jgi:hypothetical protein
MIHTLAVLINNLRGSHIYTEKEKKISTKTEKSAMTLTTINRSSPIHSSSSGKREMQSGEREESSGKANQFPPQKPGKARKKQWEKH